MSDLSVQSTADKLSRFLRSLGADLVLDLKVAEDWSILELQREVLERWRNREQAGPNPRTKSHTVLSSLCPGWVCYAEKTHGDWLLPHISRWGQFTLDSTFMTVVVFSGLSLHSS